MSKNNISLKGHFLIAMPGMEDPRFTKTVTLLCEHNEEGALGVIINRPTEMTLGTLLDNLKITAEDLVIRHIPVYLGGPVQTERGFILHRPLGKWQTTLTVSEEVGLTTSRDFLESVAAGSFSDECLIALGHAGWAPGQLEDELAQNAWLTAPADFSILFDLAAEFRFDAAMSLLIPETASLSSFSGRA